MEAEASNADALERGTEHPAAVGVLQRVCKVIVARNLLQRKRKYFRKRCDSVWSIATDAQADGDWCSLNLLGELVTTERDYVGTLMVCNKVFMNGARDFVSSGQLSASDVSE